MKEADPGLCVCDESAGWVLIGKNGRFLPKLVPSQGWEMMQAVLAVDYASFWPRPCQQ